MDGSGIVDNDASQSQRTQPAQPLETTPTLVNLVLRVCWFSIVLGIVIQVLLLIVAATAGRVPKASPLIASVAQTISWSTLVCVGIAIGGAASRFRADVMGFAGLLSAPLAFTVAKSVHRGVAGALGLAQSTLGGPSPLVLGIIKSAEYCCLAALVGWIITRGKSSLLTHALAGLFNGIVFGGTALGYILSRSAVGMSTAELLSRGINEVLFPMGCSVVLFATQALAKSRAATPALEMSAKGVA